MKKNNQLDINRIQNAQAHFNHGMLYLKETNYKNAESEFRKGLSIDPVEIITSLALIYQSLCLGVNLLGSSI